MGGTSLEKQCVVTQQSGNNLNNGMDHEKMNVVDMVCYPHIRKSRDMIRAYFPLAYTFSTTQFKQQAMAL